MGRGPNISLHPTDATETVTRLVDEELKNLSQLDLVQALVFSRDGKQLYSGSFQEVIAWDTATGKIIRRYTGLADRAVALDISPDGQLLAVAGGA
ncbi:MAG TPA: hypothetical protein PKD72_03690, partial [Gemmatales bacterium]|nr:hypothetical protein [Gemmatales bacterium]